jgi:hypothetical protein
VRPGNTPLAALWALIGRSFFPTSSQQTGTRNGGRVVWISPCRSHLDLRLSLDGGEIHVVRPKARNLLPTESGDHRISLAAQLPSYQAGANGGLQLLAAIPALASPTMRRSQVFVVSVERSLTRSPGNRHQPPCLAHPHATVDHEYRTHRCHARERERTCALAAVVLTRRSATGACQ